MTDTPLLNLDDRPFARGVLPFWGAGVVSARTVLVLAMVIDCLLFYYAAAWLRFPELRGFDGSIMYQGFSSAGFVIVAVLLVIGTLIGTAIAGAVRFEAGLFAAAFALMFLSRRCGNMQQVLFEAGGNAGVFWRLAIELAILGLFFAGIWWGLWVLAKAALGETPGSQASSPGLANNLTATAAQIIATAIMMYILCQSTAKNQTEASVGIASWVGAMTAYKYASARPSIWYWIGPIILGIIGYLIGACGQDWNLQIGLPTGTFASLARPLPLDYASVGVAGAILGYWMMRKGDATAE